MDKIQFYKFSKISLGSDLILPAVLLLSYAVFLYVIRGILPASEELVNLFSEYYARYGYEILFVAAILESLILVNLFAPGQVTLALGIIFSRTGETELPYVMIAVISGIMVGILIDYFIGYYGFGDLLKKFKQESFFNTAKKELKKNGGGSIFISFINPNLASYISLAAGASKVEMTTFFLTAAFSTLFWVTAWSLLIYSVGDIFLIIIRKYALVFSAIFTAILLVSFTWRRNTQ